MSKLKSLQQCLSISRVIWVRTDYIVFDKTKIFAKLKISKCHICNRIWCSRNIEAFISSELRTFLNNKYIEILIHTHVNILYIVLVLYKFLILWQRFNIAIEKIITLRNPSHWTSCISFSNIWHKGAKTERKGKQRNLYKPKINKIYLINNTMYYIIGQNADA